MRPTAIFIGPARSLMTKFRASLGLLDKSRRLALCITVVILSPASPKRSWALDYPVTNTNSSGPGSFQAAIVNGNADPGSTITFQNNLGTINVGALPDLSGSL